MYWLVVQDLFTSVVIWLVAVDLFNSVVIWLVAAVDLFSSMVIWLVAQDLFSSVVIWLVAQDLFSSVVVWLVVPADLFVSLVLWLVAEGLLYGLCALLAVHPAAPVELTVAVLLDLFEYDVVTTPAAHEGAAVQTRARAVTLAPPGAQRPQIGVHLAEVWRVIQVDEVQFGGLLLTRADRLQLGAALVDDDAAGTVKLTSEGRADHAEGGHGAPTDADGARAGHTVTLTQQLHAVLYRLKTENNYFILLLICYINA